MKIGAFGEVMLRLNPPEYFLLEQTNTLLMSFTGSGVNLLSNLAHLGKKSYLMTMVPENRIGEAAIANLNKLAIETVFVGQKDSHIGSYFAEMGYGPRATQVTYQNRRNSSFCNSQLADYDLMAFLAEVDLVHICGISLSLTDTTAETAQKLAEEAKAQGKIVCFDFNFRPSLNDQPGQRELMKQRYEKMIPYCDLLFGSVRDLVELLGYGPQPQDKAAATTLIQQFMEEFEIQWFAGTNRRYYEGAQSLTGKIYTPKEVFISKEHQLQVLDRIGAGDSFAASVIYGIAEKWPLAKTVEFATASAILAHTMHGDVPLVTEKMVNHYLEHPSVDLLR
ncbi:2-dehydro-3-deoxygluconokinase [Enterococcus sp. PF1-24]|uniref:sugar kinase n=1 Tax=unclassified Enterococcus TaxID=2608891 RepID=UPI0024751B95|nr:MULTISPECIES: sugar kinase [unclassified Enterococcus]MDH6363421.1 2-dehydro-3-deoxygluconokinase [Enterococcus sp. PFB1-1]MDH6400515.1 2-dehydro-3-deoxygluconokinase [Enterococcus sp. PF1-24]